MQLPDRVAGLKWITLLWGIYAVIWALLESGLWQTVFLAALCGVVFFAHVANRVLTGRKMSLGIWLLLTAVLGALLGLGSALLTVSLMGVKTGLHAHGPEFSVLEIDWVIQQIPLWTLAGLLGGLGLGLLLKVVCAKTD